MKPHKAPKSPKPQLAAMPRSPHASALICSTSAYHCSGQPPSVAFLQNNRPFSLQTNIYLNPLPLCTLRVYVCVCVCVFKSEHHKSMGAVPSYHTPPIGVAGFSKMCPLLSFLSLCATVSPYGAPLFNAIVVFVCFEKNNVH